MPPTQCSASARTSAAPGRDSSQMSAHRLIDRGLSGQFRAVRRSWPQHVPRRRGPRVDSRPDGRSRRRSLGQADPDRRRPRSRVSVLRRSAAGGGARGSFARSGSPAGLSGANIFVSLLFTVCHLWSHSPIWAVLVFFPSLAFGYLRDRFGSTVPSILMHMWYNGGYFFLVGSSQSSTLSDIQ